MSGAKREAEWRHDHARGVTATLAMLALLLLGACESDNYETGDGKYSYLRADFVEAHSKEAKLFDTAVTDDGDELVFVEPLSCSWAATPDSIYRALIYYNVGKKNDPKSVAGISASQVLVLRLPLKQPEKAICDPLKVESTWLSANGKYFNLGLYVMVGKTEEENLKQSLGIVRDTIVDLDNGTKLHQLRLLHSQNGVPENYSTKIYASIPLEYFSQGDVVRLDVNTYNGPLNKTFQVGNQVTGM